MIITGCRSRDTSIPLPPVQPPVGDFDPSLRHILLHPEEVTEPFYWMSEYKIKYYEERQRRAPQFVRFLDPSKPSPTVRASYAKSRGAEALVVHGPKLMRMLTEGELAKIQSFPNTYVFTGSRTARYKHIGNAVPPLLAMHIGMAIVNR